METVIFSPTSRFLKWPLGRVLVVIFAFAVVVWLKVFHVDGAVEEIYIGFHFGMSTGLACWAVLSPGPLRLGRLGLALLLAMSSGILYPDDYPDWLTIAAVIGVYSGLNFAVMVGLLLVVKWWRRRGAAGSERPFQFGIKHLLWATVVMIPLALLVRIALPQFSETDALAVVIVGLDSIAMGLVTHWLLGHHARTASELAGRVALSALIAGVVATMLSTLPLGSNLRSFDWFSFQAMLWLLLTAGYLLPRFDRLVVVIRRREEEYSEGLNHVSPEGLNHVSPEGAVYDSPGQRPGVEGTFHYDEP